MTDKISLVYTCDCKPGFNWKTKYTFLTHKKSQRHLNYEKTNQEKEHRKNITKLQIEKDRLVRENDQLRELYLNAITENIELKKLLVKKNL